MIPDWWNAAFVLVCIWITWTTFKNNTFGRVLLLTPIRWFIAGIFWWIITFAAGVFGSAADVHEQRQHDTHNQQQQTTP